MALPETGSVFRGTLEFLNRLGVYDTILPIIFLSLLFYAISKRLGVFNKLKKWQLIVISIVLSLVVLAVSRLIAVINEVLSDIAFIGLIAIACGILYFIKKRTDFKARDTSILIKNYKSIISLAIISFVLGVISFIFQLGYYSSHSVLTPTWPLILSIILGIISFILAILFFVFAKGVQINHWWRLLVILSLVTIFSPLAGRIWGAIYEHIFFQVDSVAISSVMLLVFIVVIVILLRKPKKREAEPKQETNITEKNEENSDSEITKEQVSEKFCSECGKKIKNNSKFCKYCGVKQ